MDLNEKGRFPRFAQALDTLIANTAFENNSVNEYETKPKLNFTAVTIAIGLMSLIMVIGCVGNFMTVLAVRSNKKLQIISSVFIINLSVCDILELCCVLPFSVYTYLADGWFINNYLCKFIGFLGYTLTGTTVLTITLISYGRYKSVLDPSVYKRVYTKGNVTGMVFAAWTIPLVCLFPAAFEVWGKFEYVPSLVTCNLSLDKSSKLLKLFLLGSRAVAPCILIAYLYAMIFRTTYRSHHRLNSINRSPLSKTDLHRYKKQMNLTRKMVLILIVFVISYFPCTVTGIIDWKNVLSKNIHMYCAISVYVGSALNPIIYGLMNRQFKKTYKEIWSCSSGVCFEKLVPTCGIKTPHICMFNQQCSSFSSLIISPSGEKSSSSCL